MLALAKGAEAEMQNAVPRIAIAVLTLLHLVGPFTPINRSDSGQIVVGAMIIGAGFAGLFVWSFVKPRAASRAALGLFIGVVALSAVTGASPVLEGLPVKVALAAALLFGSLTADMSAREGPSAADRSSM